MALVERLVHMVTTAAEVELSPRPTSAAEARRVVERALRGIDEASKEIATLLASELVTNAVLYADGNILLRIVSTDDTYRISVSDSVDRSIVPKEVGLDATSGRGLKLVDRLSAAWGVDVRERGGKEVWFDIPRRA